MKEFLRNLLLLFGAVLVTLGLSEVAFRLALPQQLIIPNHQIWRPDPDIGWRHVENTQTRINTGEGTVEFVTDSEGYRIDPEDRPEAMEPAHRILVIGDSFVEATAVEERDAFCDVLSRRLEEATGTPVRVVNDGVGSWGPSQYLREAEIALSRRRYDLGVVCLYVGNDVTSARVTEFSPQVVSQRPGFGWPRTVSKQAVVDAWLYPLNDWLEQRSHLFVFLKARSSSLLARLGLSAAYFPDIFRTSMADSDNWAITCEICRDIARRFHDANTPVLFVLLPASYQVTQAQFDEYVRRFEIPLDSVDVNQPNRLLGAAFAADSLVLLDPMQTFRQRPAESAPLYGSVDGHFNAEGHRAMAEFLLPHVLVVIGDQASASARTDRPGQPGAALH